uniref:Uncharacterized protein n=1 Tax=Pan troglodytes TaxID=9598 RepID=A0A2I3SZR5_PANTR
ILFLSRGRESLISIFKEHLLDFFSTTTKEGYDRLPVDITPLEERKLTFDTHALVQDLETLGFDKTQAETTVSALTTLSNVSPDTTYKETVTQAQQKITVQQLMAHLDSIRKNMVSLEKSEFTNLRAENEKMKIELDQICLQIKKSNLWKQLQNLQKRIPKPKVLFQRPVIKLTQKLLP